MIEPITRADRSFEHDPGLAERVREYTSSVAAGTVSADGRNALVRDFTPFVIRIARRYARHSRMEIDDLAQVGLLAMLRAVDRWTTSTYSDAEFMSYVIATVRGAILRHFRDTTWSVRYPRPARELSHRINAAAEQLYQELGRAPRPREIAEHAGVDEKLVVEALEAYFNHDAISYDAAETESATLLQRFGEWDPGFDQVDERDTLRRAMSTLAPRERRIIYLRFIEDRSQSQIAVEIGISQMHVSRILAATVSRLRATLRAAS